MEFYERKYLKNRTPIKACHNNKKPTANLFIFLKINNNKTVCVAIIFTIN